MSKASFKKFLAIDLELEQPYTRAQTEDSKIDKERIIQAGLVAFEANDGDCKIIEEKSMFLHYPHEISSFIRNLTRIRSSEVNNSVLSIDDVFAEMKRMVAEHDLNRQLIEWGSGDASAIQSELSEGAAKEFGEFFARSKINVALLSKIYLGKGVGLKKCCNILGIKPPGMKKEVEGKLVDVSYHDALFDAKATAHVFSRLINEMKRK